MPAVLRRMTPEQRWRAAHRLYWTLRRHKAVAEWIERLGLEVPWSEFA